MSGNPFEDFALFAKQLQGIDSAAIFIMMIAILLGMILVSLAIIRQQGVQIRAVLATNTMIVKDAEERHKRNIERFEERLKDAENARDRAEKRTEKREIDNNRLQQEKIDLQRKYEHDLREMRDRYEKEILMLTKKVDDALQELRLEQGKNRQIIEDKDEQIAELNIIKKNLESKLSNVSKELEDINETLDGMQEEKDNLNIKLAEEVNKNVHLLKQVSQSEKAYSVELERLNKINETLENKLKEQENEIRNRSEASSTNLEESDSSS